MTKVLTLLGTRPEIIRLSRVIALLDESCDHRLAHTGQNYDDRLSGMFFRELDVREPDVYMGVRGTGFADQIGQMFAKCEELFLAEKPDTVLILGDTNTGLAASSPSAWASASATWRRATAVSTTRSRGSQPPRHRPFEHGTHAVHVPQRRDLVREGIERQRVYVTGNPIKEVLDHHTAQIEVADPFTQFDVEPGGYFLVTAHRAR